MFTRIGFMVGVNVQIGLNDVFLLLLWCGYNLLGGGFIGGLVVVCGLIFFGFSVIGVLVVIVFFCV